jgi:hypothetical protein
MIKWKPSKKHFLEIRNALFIHDDETNVDYHLHKEEDTLILLFQYTNDKKDWHSDLNYYETPINLFPDSNIKGHKGLYKQYLGVRNKFLDMCYDEDIKRIYISGYSLGGGLTQYAVEDAAWHFPNKEVFGISYNGPRVFCPNKEVEKTIGDKCILIKSHWDIVGHLPFKMMVVPFFKIYFFPFSIKPSKFHISFWKDYGKLIWIGKLWRILPFQHSPEQIEKGLLENFKN